MKLIIKFGNGNSEIRIEANPRLRDFESTTERVVEQAIKSGLRMGLIKTVTK